MYYCLLFPDAPTHTGSPGVEYRNTEFFYWGIKRKIKALGIRNLTYSSSGNLGGSEEESSSDTIMTFIEKESKQMVKTLTSDLVISFRESHYPPLLVSPLPLPFFLLCFWKHTVQGSGLQTFWTLKLSGMHMHEFSLCVAISESHWWLKSSLVFSGHSFVWVFELSIINFFQEMLSAERRWKFQIKW